MERVSQLVPFRRIASASLDLKQLLDDAVMGRRRCELAKEGSGGGRVGKVDISIRLGEPLGPAVQALREPRSSSKAGAKSAAMLQPMPPFLSVEKPPYKLRLTVVRAEKLRCQTCVPARRTIGCEPRPFRGLFIRAHVEELEHACRARLLSRPLMHAHTHARF